MGDIYPNGKFIGLQTFLPEDGSVMSTFTYSRLRAANKALYPCFPDEPPTLAALQLIYTTQTGTKMITRLYNASEADKVDVSVGPVGKWNAILPQTLSENEWETCCNLTGQFTANGNLRLIHYKYVHQLYYTPAQLYKYGLRDSHCCRRCGADKADFYHLAWSSLKVAEFWEKVTVALTEMGGEPIVCNMTMSSGKCAAP